MIRDFPNQVQCSNLRLLQVGVWGEVSSGPLGAQLGHLMDSFRSTPAGMGTKDKTQATSFSADGFLFFFPIVLLKMTMVLFL